jgi:transposase-like protein
MKDSEKRNEIVLKALDPETNISELAREYGIARQTVYNYLDYVLDDAEERLRQAEKDVLFRIEVLRLRGWTEAEIEAILESVEAEAAIVS